MKTQTKLFTLLLIILMTFDLQAQFDSVWKLAGTIDPKANLISFDECLPFKEGFAKLTKGNSYALINSNGQFLVKFGEYDYVDEFHNGYCYVIKNEKAGYIDKLGKLRIPLIFNETNSFQQDGFAKVGKYKDPSNWMAGMEYFWIDKYAKTYKFKEEFKEEYNLLSDGIYNRIGGKIVNHSIKFDRKGTFQNGHIKIAKKNEFGELKWGFMNQKGELSIPFKYSTEPGDFSCNLAVVVPTNDEEFNFGYINTKDQLLIKVKIDNNSLVYGGYGSRSPFTDNKFNNSGWVKLSTITTRQLKAVLMDTTGEKYEIEKIFREANPTLFSDAKSVSVDEIQDEDIIFKTSGYGLGNVSGIVSIPPLFSRLTFFDNEANLAFAELKTKNGKEITGYIDRSGKFIILKEANSEW